MFPELTEGPVRDGYFVIGMVMRPDGSVLSHVIRHATPEDLQQVVSEVELSVPRDGDGRGSSTRSRRTSLPDGRTLRADIMVLHALVDENYDITRSDVRVRQIVGGRFTGLMQPRDSEALNRVVVLLSEDGTIRREFVERVPVASAGSGSAPDSASLMRIAERFAEQMEVEPDQIGLMGNTVLEKHGESGAQILMVRYAWQRRSTEDGPSLGQTSAATRAPRINAADALLVVKHVLPDAFTHQDASIGAPTIVLTAEGRVIQAGWVRTEAGRPIADTLKEQLVPGVETGYFSGVTLTDENGVTARVSLAWENPKAPQER